MGLKGILSISGMPGLFKVLAQTKTGFIVESLSDKKRFPVSSTQRISMLDDISVFSTSDDIPLRNVLLRIKEQAASRQVADPKSDIAHLRAYFKEVVPEYDEDRVYPSDIKKILTWYHLVKDLVDQDEPNDEEAAQVTEPPVETEEQAPESEASKPVKKKKQPSKS